MARLILFLMGVGILGLGALAILLGFGSGICGSIPALGAIGVVCALFGAVMIVVAFKRPQLPVDPSRPPP